MAFPLLPVRVLHADPALGKVRALDESPDGLSFWAGTDSGTVRNLSMADGTLLRQYHAHKGGVTTLQARGEWLVTGGRDGYVRLWRVNGLSLECQAKAPGRQILAAWLEVEDGRFHAITMTGAAEWDLSGRPVRVDEWQRFEGDLRKRGPVAGHAWMLNWWPPRLNWLNFERGGSFESFLKDIISVHALEMIEETAVVVGSGRNREELMELFKPPAGEHLRTWGLPFGVASLLKTAGGRELVAGGTGRVFAIDLRLE